MKKFIIKTLLLLLPLLILAIPVEYFLQQIPNDYSCKKNYLDNQSKEIQTLILGASHAYYGINPVYFSQNTFNASHVSQSLDFDWAILDKYQNKLDSLNVIVLPISYYTLWGKLGIDAKRRVKNYTLYYGMNANSLSEYSELLTNNLKQNLSRLYYYYVKNKNEITCTELGWGTAYNSKKAQNLQETGKTAAKRHTKDDIFSKENRKIFEDNLKMLNSFSRFCNQRNITLILLTTPTYYTYRENLSTEQLNKMVETIADFVNNNLNTYHLNWHENTDFVAENFYDADHLNEKGAEIFSTKLAKDIDSLKILKNFYE